jgi:S1-C subfamily serine protease
MQDDGRTQQSESNATRDPLDDLVNDAELIARSQQNQPCSAKAKQSERGGGRLGILVASLAVVTGLLIAQWQQSREGLNPHRSSPVSERRVASTPVKNQLARDDSVVPQKFNQADDEYLAPILSGPDFQPRTSVAQKPTERISPPRIEDAPPRTPEELFARVSSSVVRINVRNAQTELIGIGSGFFVRDDSTVVTNFHVIDGAEFVEVVYQDGRESLAWEAESFDEISDVVVLHVRHGEKTVVRSLPLGLELPPVASKAYVIGAPKGLDHSFSEGSISGRREIDGRTWIQTTAPISPGSSGSPVFSDKGLVVGMATRFRVDGQNLNFAIASRHIRDLLPDRVKSSLVALSELPSRKPLQKQAAAPAKPADPVQPKDDENRLKEAERHIAGGVVRRALQTLDDIPAANRGPRYWRVRARALFTIASYQEAAKCFSEALRLDGKDADTWIEYAVALRMDPFNNFKSVDAILSACRAALKINRDEARAYHLMGLTLHGGEERIDAFKTVLSIDEANLGAHFHLGCELNRTKQGKAEAIKHFKRALELSGDAEKFQSVNAEPFNPANSLKQRYEIDDFSDRNSFETFLKLQLAAVYEGDERIAICREVLKSEPNNDLAIFLIGTGMRELGREQNDANLVQQGDALRDRFETALGNFAASKYVALMVGHTGILVIRK